MNSFKVITKKSSKKAACFHFVRFSLIIHFPQCEGAYWNIESKIDPPGTICRRELDIFEAMIMTKTILRLEML